jgi:prefoldin subunit 5
VKIIIEKIDSHNEKYREQLEAINMRTSELYNWHNVVDEDNVKVWYLRKSFTEAITKISKNTEETSKLLMKMTQSMETMSEILHYVREEQKINSEKNKIK